MASLTQIENSALYSSETELWQSRLEMLETPFEYTYLELGELWGISKNGVYLKIRDWARDFPESVKLIEGRTRTDPTIIAFTFDAPPSLDEYTEENTGGTVQETTMAMDELADNERNNVEDRPDFISEKVYTQTLERLEAIGLVWENIIWQELAWNKELVKDLISVVTSFSAKLYPKHGRKGTAFVPEDG